MHFAPLITGHTENFGPPTNSAKATLTETATAVLGALRVQTQMAKLAVCPALTVDELENDWTRKQSCGFLVVVGGLVEWLGLGDGLGERLGVGLDVGEGDLVDVAFGDGDFVVLDFGDGLELELEVLVLLGLGDTDLDAEGVELGVALLLGVALELALLLGVELLLELVLLLGVLVGDLLADLLPEADALVEGELLLLGLALYLRCLCTALGAF